MVSVLIEENSQLQKRVEELLTAVGDWESYCEVMKQNLKEEREQNERLKNVARDTEIVKDEYEAVSTHFIFSCERNVCLVCENSTATVKAARKRGC